MLRFIDRQRIESLGGRWLGQIDVICRRFPLSHSLIDTAKPGLATNVRKYSLRLILHPEGFMMHVCALAGSLILSFSVRLRKFTLVQGC